jgi:hypothetical protein
LSERLDLIGFTANKDANMSDDPSVNPPAGDISSDKEDRMRDFFKRHGGPSGDPIHHVETERGTSGWSETYAKDGYALRCDWSRVGGKEEMQFVELPRPPMGDQAELLSADKMVPPPGPAPF